MLKINRIDFNGVVSSPQQQKQVRHKQNKDQFQNLFKEAIKQSNKLKFSKHAQARLESRKINLNEQEINKLESAVTKARNKGAKESLVLINQNAYIVSVKNNTVITAMDQQSMKDDVVTNIDSAIVMN